MSKYLVKITIPSVQELISQSRKLVDLHNGSSLIPNVLQYSLEKLEGNIEFLIPSKETIQKHPENITNVVYLIIDEDKDEDNLKKEMENFKETVRNSLKEILFKNLEKKLQERIKDYNDLILYQIYNSIKVVWGAVLIDKEGLKKAKEKVDKVVAYLKSSILPDTDKIESYNLISKDNNLFFEEDFKQFLENQRKLHFQHVSGAVLCSICGKRAIIGATQQDPSGKDFWEEIQKNFDPQIKSGEKLCGFCLSKRFSSSEKFESVVDIALNELENIDKIRNELKQLKFDIQDVYEVEWENDKNKREKVESILSKYNIEQKDLSPFYGLIMADGDGMGEKVKEAFESEEEVKKFTEIMSSYAKKFGEIVKNQKGEVIYSGGDDILAILPKNKTLEAYSEIKNSFDLSTISGGIVYAHYKVPLSHVLSILRENEKNAKSSGKDGVYISYVKHSLSSSECFIKNDKIEDFKKLINIVSNKKFPNTFIYQLETLLRPYGDETEKVQEVKILTEYLIDKKDFPRKEEFKDLMFNNDMLMGREDKIIVKDVIGKLKVAKFLAAGGQDDNS